MRIISPWLDRNAINPRVVARRLLHSYLRQLLEDNLFHADLHPGNIFLLRENRLALLDFGSVGFNEGDLLRKYDAFLEGLSLGRYAKAIDIFLMIMPDLPGSGLVAAKEDLQRSLQSWGERCRVKELPYKEKSASFVFDEMSRIMARHGVSISWPLFKVLRGWATLDASLRELNPETDLLALKRRYMEKRQMRQLKRVTGRMPATLMTMQNILDYPREFSETAAYKGAMIRRMAQLFEGNATRISRLLAMVFGAGGLLNWAGVLLVGFFMFHQHGGVRFFMKTALLERIATSIPHLDIQVWLLMTAGLAYQATILTGLARRFGRDN